MHMVDKILLKGEKLTPFTGGAMAPVLLSLVSIIYLAQAWTSMLTAAASDLPFSMVLIFFFHVPVFHVLLPLFVFCQNL